MIPKIKPYVENFQKKGLGLFVHYGPYITYNSGEWCLNSCGIDKQEYEKKAMETDYSSFDANNIIKSAKACGAKYITFTTRHHDGFSLYDTKGLSNYGVMNTKNGKDLVKEFVDACKKNDIMPFLYHTTLDWHHPDFNNDFAKYQQYLFDSIKILCQNYGEIGGFWFDGNWSRPSTDWDVDTLYSIIRQYQPNAIIINNTGLHQSGVLGHEEIDCVTFEQAVPQKLNLEGLKKHYIGEMCYPICEHWGIADDINVKSMKSILEAFLSSRKVGGNFLLGIFTNIDGSQPLLHQGYLEALGKWIKRNDIALFDTKTCDIEGSGKDFALTKDNKVYFFIQDINTSGDEYVLLLKNKDYTLFKNVKGKLKNGKWLGDNKPVELIQDIEKEITFIKPLPFAYGESWISRVAEFDIED